MKLRQRLAIKLPRWFVCWWPVYRLLGLTLEGAKTETRLWFNPECYRLVLAREKYREWPPTPLSALCSIYGASRVAATSAGTFIAGDGPGVFVSAPKHVKTLLDEGLAETLNISMTTGAVALTQKGSEAVEMLMGVRHRSAFRQPDWLLSDLTK